MKRHQTNPISKQQLKERRMDAEALDKYRKNRISVSYKSLVDIIRNGSGRVVDRRASL